MDSLGEMVRSVFKKLNREQKNFFGGPPYSSEVKREVSNFEKYKQSGLADRKRVCLGSCFFDNGGNVIGYQASTIMQSANPTIYETRYLSLEPNLDYVQLKKILVDPDYFGKGISDTLLALSPSSASNLKPHRI